MVAAPALTRVAPLEAVLSALRATQKALEATQMSTFGAEVLCLTEIIHLACIYDKGAVTTDAVLAYK